jgi:hypothetical protein
MNVSESAGNFPTIKQMRMKSNGLRPEASFLI